MGRKRSNERVITTQSRVIRYMRLKSGVGQREAGRAVGCSEGAIGHYENGRMSVPESRARQLVALYGFAWSEYESYIAGKPFPVVSLKDECMGLLNRISSEEKLRAVHTILASFIS